MFRGYYFHYFIVKQISWMEGRGFYHNLWLVDVLATVSKKFWLPLTCLLSWGHCQEPPNVIKCYVPRLYLWLFLNESKCIFSLLLWLSTFALSSFLPVRTAGLINTAFIPQWNQEKISSQNLSRKLEGKLRASDSCVLFMLRCYGRLAYPCSNPWPD